MLYVAMTMHHRGNRSADQYTTTCMHTDTHTCTHTHTLQHAHRNRTDMHTYTPRLEATQKFLVEGTNEHSRELHFQRKHYLENKEAKRFNCCLITLKHSILAKYSCSTHQPSTLYLPFKKRCPPPSLPPPPPPPPPQSISLHAQHGNTQLLPHTVAWLEWVVGGGGGGGDTLQM